jgi:hypothetical protein
MQARTSAIARQDCVMDASAHVVMHVQMSQRLFTQSLIFSGHQCCKHAWLNVIAGQRAPVLQACVVECDRWSAGTSVASMRG